MRVLITAGPTREPIDPVRYIGNRSTGQMGQSLVTAAISAGHSVTLILGPVELPMPTGIRRIDIETTQQLQDAVLSEFPNHDLLIMAAAVADYRPKVIQPTKLERSREMTIELEPTTDILAAAGKVKRADQRTVGFSLVDSDDLARSIEKLRSKNADLIVSNPLNTIASEQIESVLLWPDGRREELPARNKAEFATLLMARSAALFR